MGDLHLVTLAAGLNLPRKILPWISGHGALRQDLSHFIRESKAFAPMLRARPNGRGTAFNCHGFQSRMAAVVRDEDGWKDRVNFMRTTEHYFLTPGVTDEMGDHIAAYINSVFGQGQQADAGPLDAAWGTKIWSRLSPIT